MKLDPEGFNRFLNGLLPEFLLAPLTALSSAVYDQTGLRLPPSIWVTTIMLIGAVAFYSRYRRYVGRRA